MAEDLVLLREPVLDTLQRRAARAHLVAVRLGVGLRASRVWDEREPEKEREPHESSHAFVDDGMWHFIARREYGNQGFELLGVGAGAVVGLPT